MDDNVWSMYKIAQWKDKNRFNGVSKLMATMEGITIKPMDTSIEYKIVKFLTGKANRVMSRMTAIHKTASNQ